MSLIGEGMELMQLLDKAKNQELYKQLGEWIDKVEKMKVQVDQLSDENKTLKEQIRFKGVVERVNGHTFVQGEDDEICPRCAEVEIKPVHLIAHHVPRMPGQTAFCPGCKTEFMHNLPYTRDFASQVKRRSTVL